VAYKVGSFIDTGAIYDERNVYLYDSTTPADIPLGVIPQGHFLEEIKLIVIDPAPDGSTLKVIDQTDAEIIAARKFAVDRQGTYTASNVKVFDEEATLTAKLEGDAGTAQIIIIKKLIRIPEA